MRVVIPERGVIEVATKVNPLTTNRSTTYRFDLFDDSGKKFGELDGVVSGSVEWDANAAVKGGGKIVVSRSNAVHKRQIRVAKNRPFIGERSFEAALGGFGHDPLLTHHDAPAEITRNTDLHYENAASLDVEWAAGTADQTCWTTFDGLVVGDKYTFVARVLNPDAESVYLRAANGYAAVSKRNGWQVVAVTFTAAEPTVDLHIRNTAPEADQHTNIDYVALYKGVTTNFNGEHFEYAPFTWLHARVRPVLVIEGVKEHPLGMFIPAAPIEQWDEGGGRQEIELLDRTSILSQDYVEDTYTVEKGENVVAAVRKVIHSTGEKAGALTNSDDVLNADMTWGPGTNKLTIVNDLLDAAGFFALWADGNGQFRVEEYREPKRRPVTYELLDNQDSIYIPTLSIDEDIYSIPNKVIMTAQGDGEDEGWTAIATNENEANRFSFQNRGRWITDIQLGVEATSQPRLQQKARRRLAELMSTQATVEIQHGPVPRLGVNDVVRFRRQPAKVDTLFTVTKTSLDFDPTALAKTTLTEVIDLD